MIIDASNRFNNKQNEYKLTLPGDEPIRRRVRTAPGNEQSNPLIKVTPNTIADMYDVSFLNGFEVPESQDMLRRVVDDKLTKDEEKAIGLIAHYKKKWPAFFKYEMGVDTSIWRDDHPPHRWKNGDPLPLWSAQRDIIDALIKHRRVAVKSGHGVSKTHTAAAVVFLLTYVFGASGLTTSTVFRQVRRGLWGEINKLWQHASTWRRLNEKPPLGGRINQTSIELAPDWFVEGFSTNKPEQKVPGIHQGKMFVVIDEAGVIEPSIFDMMETVLTNEEVWVLIIGNPTDPTHPFAQYFKPGSGYYPMTLSCYDCPNVKHKRNIYPGMTTYQWVKRREEKWGKESALFQSRVLGEFPKADSAGLIPYNYIEDALKRILPEDKLSALGVDVARGGGDRIVITGLFESGRVKVFEFFDKARTTETEGRVKFWADKYSYVEEDVLIRPTINIDDIGVGGGVTDHLYEDGYPVNGINVSESPYESPDEEGRLSFANLRAQYYWKLAQLFIDGLISIEPNKEDWDDVHYDLANELSKLKLKPNSKNTIQIIEKAEIKKHLKGISPDLMESVMLACSELDVIDNHNLVGWISR